MNNIPPQSESSPTYPLTKADIINVERSEMNTLLSTGQCIVQRQVGSLEIGMKVHRINVGELGGELRYKVMAYEQVTGGRIIDEFMTKEDIYSALGVQATITVEAERID